MSAKRTSFPPLATPVVRKSSRVSRKLVLNEAMTAVTTGLTTSKGANGTAGLGDDVSNGDSASDDEGPESEDEETTKAFPSKASKSKATEDGADVDTQMTEAKVDDTLEQLDASDPEPTSPTFGDLMRGTSTVDVSSSLAAQAPTEVARPNNQTRAVAPITSSSLGTVLNQALKTDDQDLLESCLQINDFKIIQNTINRMDSSLAVVLLSKLADRMHRRPGRAFGLMRWMQWTLVAHGGTLVAHPNLLSQMEKLNRVLEERARALPSLLALRGKLDMLDAQMKYRRAIRNAKASDAGEESDDPDEAGVVYVEGQEEQSSSRANGLSTTLRGDDHDFAVMNGINEDSDDSEEEEFDDQVDELDAESMDEDEVIHDDVEDESGDEYDQEDDDDDDNAPPSKVQKTTKLVSRK